MKNFFIEWKKDEHIKILNLSNENVDRNIIIKKLNECQYKNLVNFLDTCCEKIKDKFDFYKEEIDLNLFSISNPQKSKFI